MWPCKKLRKNSMLCFIFSFVIIEIAGVPTIRTTYDIWSDNDGNELMNGTSNGTNANNYNGDDNNNLRQSKVLNFFPVPVEEECLSNDKRRRGICMNAYECRIQGGSSHGPCALGFGVCCVFTATCGDPVIANNLTYFVNPNFPDYARNLTGCSLQIKRIDPDVVQLRLDFVHFLLGQPNRKSGVCDEDVFFVTAGSRNFTLCGTNNDQHVYIDVDDNNNNGNNDPITIDMRLTRRTSSRIWEILITQLPFTQRAPAGCFQYFTGRTGVIRTLNFAENGRHLANQDYSICTRQENDACGIAYEPCDDNSFRIAPNNGEDASPGSEIVMMDGGNVLNEDIVGNAEGSGDGSSSSSTSTSSSTARADLCGDRVTLPCDSDDFLMVKLVNLSPMCDKLISTGVCSFLLLKDGDIGIGFCSLVHCGSALCPLGEDPCRIESTATPFTIGVHFGVANETNDYSADDNIGMCLRYEQLDCVE